MALLDRTHDLARRSDEWVLDLFHRAAQRVPAYRRFLAVAGFDPRSVRSIEEFATVPAVTASGYVCRFPVRDLFLDGEVGQASLAWTVCGAPSWACGPAERSRAAQVLGGALAELGTTRRRTLVLAAGDACYALAMLDLRDKGHRLTSVVPGTDVEASVRALGDLAALFEQTVVYGPPALVTDVLDAAVASGVDLESRRVRVAVAVAGEPRSEPWRQRVAELIRGDPVDDIRAIYQDTRAGPIGVETPATIELRRSGWGAPHVEMDAAPMVVEYDPTLFHVETDGRSLLVTVDGMVPLLRYRVGDAGWPLKLADRSCIAIAGSAETGVSFRGLDILPEGIALGLKEPDLAGRITRRFTMAVHESESDAAGEQLELVVECVGHPFNDPGLAERVRAAVVAALVATHPGYRRLHAEHGSAGEPSILLVEPGDLPKRA
jgi:phenylacetate-CoA ligase